YKELHRHLRPPKGVTAETPLILVDEVVPTKATGGYQQAVKGRQLWPLIWTMIAWGNENYLDRSGRRTYRHADCGGTIANVGSCGRCQRGPDVGDLVVHPPQRPRDPQRDDPVSRALRRPHRMLDPI